MLFKIDQILHSCNEPFSVFKLLRSSFYDQPTLFLFPSVLDSLLAMLGLELPFDSLYDKFGLLLSTYALYQDLTRDA